MKRIEYFPIVDESGNVIGRASRTECHTGSFILHPVVHLHLFNSKGELYLQKRAENKDIQPGKWDSSVGGHVDYGESVETALHREVSEELGITKFTPIFAFRYVFKSNQENELINSFYTFYDAEINPDPVEISEGRFWEINEIDFFLGKNIFTPNFESEFIKLKKILNL